MGADKAKSKTTQKKRARQNALTRKRQKDYFKKSFIAMFLGFFLQSSQEQKRLNSAIDIHACRGALRLSNSAYFL